MTQEKILAGIRKLTDKIQGIRAKFALPKSDQGRFDTYGGALALQKAKAERQTLQGQLDPIRLIATGITCRDCAHFADLDGPTCWRFGTGKPTRDMRCNGGDCGPQAELFQSNGRPPADIRSWSEKHRRQGEETYARLKAQHA